MTKQPTDDQLFAAADWLESYEPAPDDKLGAELKVVADWLVHFANDRRNRKIARQHNLSVTEVRQRLPQLER